MKRNLLVLLCFIFFPSAVFAKEVFRNVIIQSVKQTKTKNYEVQLLQHAAIYTAKKNNVKCLIYSLKSNEEVKIKLDVKKLEIKECHAPEAKK